MTEKNETFVAAARQLIRTIEDPAELQAELRALIEREFPRGAKPVFTPEMRLKFFEFEAAFLARYCGGVHPRCAAWPVVVESAEDGDLRLRFIGTAALNRNGD